MKKSLLIILTFTLLLNSLRHKAQVSNYTFTQSQSSYGASNTGSLIGSITQDDDVTAVPLPFNFVFNGTTYTTINVCANGYLSFNSITGFEMSPISDMSTTDILAPFGQDLFMGTVVNGDLTTGSNTISNVSSTVGLAVGDQINDFFGHFPSNPIITAITGNSIIVNNNAINTVSAYDLFVMNGSIRQNVSGVAPNRLCEFEYRNMTRFAVYNEVINFKVRLYESTNTIEFLYGNINADIIGVSSEVGLKGSAATDFNSRMVTSTNTWSTSLASTLIVDNCEFSSLNYPALGQSYLWTPGSCSPPVVNVAQSSPSICAGKSVTLALSGASNYSWSTGAITAQIVDSPTTTTTYTVFAYNGACSTSLNITQLVIASPTLTLVQSNTAICLGETATISASGAGNYSWSNGSTNNSISVSPTVTTSYTVTLSNGGCDNSATVTQFVNQKPTLLITQSKITICKGETATLTASGGSTYLWSNGSQNAQIVITPTATTSYTVKGFNGDCSDVKTIAQNVSKCTGIEESANVENKFIVYPNPFHSGLNIQASTTSEMDLKISDALGKIVYSSKLKEGATENIDTAAFNAGLYFVTLSDQSGSTTKKIIKN